MDSRFERFGRLLGPFLIATTLLTLACGPADTLPDAGFYDDAGLAPGANKPPELQRIGDRIVAVNETLVIVLEANDPDGDPLSFSAFGKLPAGSKFHKSEQRFEWTPTLAGQTVFVTFVVSDGVELDRETVRIEVTSEKTQHPPQFEILGDQQVVAGQGYDFKLSATDPDGDSITYGIEGETPAQAFIDPVSGEFLWTPDLSLIGQSVRITFTATDGYATTKLEVNFIVVAQGSTGPAPPVFVQMENVSAEVGKTVMLKLQAADPNGDPLTFAIYNGAPPSSALNGDTFTYTPQPAEEGLTYVITFSVTDGQFTAYGTLEVYVEKASGPVTCTDDPWEPNEAMAQAVPLQPGTYNASICDTELVPIDKDYYSVSLAVGQTISVTVKSDPNLGDIDLFLMDSNGVFLGQSQTSLPTEQVSYTAVTTGDVYVAVLGVGQSSFHMSYTIEVLFDATQSCSEDGYEPNDSFATAQTLPPAQSILSICPDNQDWWVIELFCGETVHVTMDTTGDDLDVSLFPPSGEASGAVATASTNNPIEVLVLESTPASGTYRLKVAGYPAGTAKGTYTLSPQVSGGCVDDGIAGTFLGGAKLLQGNDGSIGNQQLKLCCNSDFFKIGLQSGKFLNLTVSAPGGEPIGFTVFKPNGVTQAVSKPASPGGGTAQVAADTTGQYIIEVESQQPASYNLEWTVSNQGNPGGGGNCTPLSCPKYKVCDASSGECVSDFCFDSDTCPSGYTCKETYCVNACSNDAQCRTEYACKAFPEGQFCGVTGNSQHGQSCFSHASCAGADVCTFEENDGYCAAMGCTENGISCPNSTQCTLWDANSPSLCALTCNNNSDCRTEDGYTCQIWDFDSTGTCLPN